jgi:hypothetical protein
MNNLVLKELGVMRVEQQTAGRAEGREWGGLAPAGRTGGRRPRIVRQRGAAGLLEAAYSQVYRLLVLVLPLPLR